MKKIKLLLHPDYIDMHRVQFSSKTILGTLLQLGYEVEAERWDGLLKSIPADGHVIVRWSRRLPCGIGSLDLIRHCRRRHLVIHDDIVFDIEGSALNGHEAIEHVEAWIAMNEL